MDDWALIFQHTFLSDGEPASGTQITIFVEMPTDICGVIGETGEHYAQLRISPPSSGMPASITTTGRLRIDEAHEVPEGWSVRGNLTLVDEGLDLSFDFAAPACTR